MEWNIEMDKEKYIIATSKYAGPIAIMKRDQSTDSRVKNPLHIFTSAGDLLSTIKWNSGVVLDMAWSADEELLCVQTDGTVLRYDIHATFKGTFSFGKVAKETAVVDCRVFRSGHRVGIAILTTKRHFIMTSDVKDVRLKHLPTIPGLDLIPTAWTVLCKDNKQPEILVACQSNIYILDQSGRCQIVTPEMSNLPSGYLLLSLSFTNKYIAMYMEDGRIWIGSSDLQTTHCIFNTGNTTSPIQLEWCSNGAVVAYWRDLMMVIGPTEDYFSYPVDQPQLLISEIDGLRIINTQRHEFLQKVPNAVEDIIKIGSMKPAALLYEAFQEYQKGSEKADEYMRTVGQNSLADSAVPMCIEAAGSELLPSRQKSYLRAASFGKCFLSNYSPDVFVNMCQLTRVLNAIRTYGLPLTYCQLEKLGLPVLLDRLVYRKHYAVATLIADYLKMSPQEGRHRIVAHWAYYKVSETNVSDDETAHQISCKLQECNVDGSGISYAEIASRALDAGRHKLATQLLEFEARASEQVPLLMKMRLDERALNKSIVYGDTDLVYTVLLHLKDTLSASDFLMAIRQSPTAHALYLQYHRRENLDNLYDLYVQDDNYVGQGLLKVIECFKEEMFENKQACLQSSRECFSKARKEFYSKVTEDQLKLRKLQRKYSAELNAEYLDMNLHDFMKSLIKDGHNKYCDQIRRDFKVPDRRFWWLKCTALCEISDFTELEKFTKSKKSPIGYEPFVELCVEHGNLREAEKYIGRVSPDNKVKLLMLMGKTDEAIELAYERKREDELMKIGARCMKNGHKSMAERCVKLRKNLTAKK